MIIPARNGGNYLRACIESILCQDADFELIVSDDHSSDGSSDYLASLTHPNVVFLSPPKSLSMAEHWEWALSHASGEWLIFVGQDDGLQNYFFRLADKLTAIAHKKSIRAIMSRRAYFFWPGCEFVYGDISVSYAARNRFKIANSKWEALKALLSFQHYFELPHMYTSSLFHRSLLHEAKKRLGGKVFVAHPQDANLVAIACSLDSHYLKSCIPLGWVGSSPKSAGMAITSGGVNRKGPDQETLTELKIEYERKVNSSPIEYDERAGDFGFGDNAIYFWQACLRTAALRRNGLNTFLGGDLLKRLIFSSILIRRGLFINDEKGLKRFKEILFRNHCSYLGSLALGMGLLPFHALNFIAMALTKSAFPLLLPIGRVRFRVFWKQDPSMTLQSASNICGRLANCLICSLK